MCPVAFGVAALSDVVATSIGHRSLPSPSFLEIEASLRFWRAIAVWAASGDPSEYVQLLTIDQGRGSRHPPSRTHGSRGLGR
jgi:hypothetical protein